MAKLPRFRDWLETWIGRFPTAHAFAVALGIDDAKLTRVEKEPPCGPPASP